METSKFNDLLCEYGDGGTTITQVENLFAPVFFKKCNPLSRLAQVGQINDLFIYLTVSGYYMLVDGRGVVVKSDLCSYRQAEQMAGAWVVPFDDTIAPRISKTAFLNIVKNGGVSAKLTYGRRGNVEDKQFYSLEKRKGYGSIDICRAGKHSAVFYINDTPSKLLDITEDRLLIYCAAYRLYNEAEKNFIQEWENLRDHKAEMVDALTDGSGEYYRKKYFFEDRGFGYLMGQTYSGLVRDESIKGELLLAYDLQGIV